jgi:hypothetical protein
MTSPGEYADLGPLAARLARLHGFPTVITVGTDASAETRLAHPELHFIGMRPGADFHGRYQPPGFRRRLAGRPSGLGTFPLSTDVLGRSVLVCTALDLAPSGSEPDVGVLRSLLESVPVALVATSDTRLREPLKLADALAGVGLPPTLVGRTGRLESRDAALAIVDQVVGVRVDAAPPDFRVIAVMTAYNEEDVIAPSVEALVRGGIGVYLIDNWSTDRTYEIAESFLDRGLIGIERYPEAPASIYDWTGLLKRVEVVAAQIPSEWCIHHDVDERRSGPWPDHSLRDALWAVERSGFNAIDHTVLNFRPTDNQFVPGTDYETHFRHFEFGSTPDLLRQIKGWRNTGRRVELAESGGHEAAFEGRRVFPYKFLLKHYPIRSQSHGERKVLGERRSRWNAEERARGWHVQYDDVASGQLFVRRPEELVEFVAGRTERDFLVTLISGVGLASAKVPAWAIRSHVGRAVYRTARRVADGPGADSLRRSPLWQVPTVRRSARWLKRMLLGDGT